MADMLEAKQNIIHYYVLEDNNILNSSAISFVPSPSSSSFHVYNMTTEN